MDGNRDRVATTISHEMVHWLVRGPSPRCPSLLNEGLAVLIAERAQVETARVQAGVDPSRVREELMRRRIARLWKYLHRHEVYRLEDLLEVDVYAFKRRENSTSIFYDLGLCLARALEKHGAELGAPIPVLLRRLNTWRGAKHVFASLYDMRKLNHAWFDEIAEIGETVIRWRPDRDANHESGVAAGAIAPILRRSCFVRPITPCLRATIRSSAVRRALGRP